MSEQKMKRNREIERMVATYKLLDFMVKDAIRLTAEKFFLAPATVRDIIYRGPRNRGKKRRE